MLFFSGLWWNWQWQNNMVLDIEPWSMHMVMQNIHNFWFDLTHIFTISPVSQEVNEKWLPPSPGLVKLNVDGSYLEYACRSGCWGLLRTVWIVSFSMDIPCVDITLVELSAMKEGLDLAWRRGYYAMICETDCKEAFELVLCPRFFKSHVLDVVLCDIQTLLRRQWKVVLSHVSWTANQCSHYLAKMGSYGIACNVWEAPPSNMLCLLCQDVEGGMAVKL